MKILLVEDNTMNQFFIKQLLSHWNIIIDIADNGKIALEKIENSSYDLILMDMHMPIMDGPEAAIRIRKSKNPAIKNIPIVACSADVFPESKKKALASGMNFYLTKPLSEEALEQILFSLKPEKMPTEKNSNSTTLVSKKEIHTPILKKCDLSLLKETFDNDPEIIAGVLLKKAIKNKDFASIKATSHKMKSSFKTLGLLHETEILQKMENLSKEEKGYIKIQKLANEITLSFPLIIEEVESLIKNLSS